MIIDHLIELVDAHDPGLAGHARRTGRMAKTFADALGWSVQASAELATAVVLHDVGKLAVRQEILRKPGRLTPDEYEEVKTHATAGSALLASFDIPLFQFAAEIALRHHERWDGTGYPGQLRAWEIPEPARIMAIVDVFDALLDERIYRQRLSMPAVLDIMRQGRGRYFDPQLLDRFFEILPDVLSARGH